MCTAWTVCDLGHCDTSRDLPLFGESHFVGFLCLLGGSICLASASGYAEHKGMET